MFTTKLKLRKLAIKMQKEFKGDLRNVKIGNWNIKSGNTDIVFHLNDIFVYERHYFIGETITYGDIDENMLPLIFADLNYCYEKIKYTNKKIEEKASKINNSKLKEYLQNKNHTEQIEGE